LIRQASSGFHIHSIDVRGLELNVVLTRSFVLSRLPKTGPACSFLSFGCSHSSLWVWRVRARYPLAKMAHRQTVGVEPLVAGRQGPGRSRSTPNRALLAIAAQVVGAVAWMALATVLLISAAVAALGGSFDACVMGAGLTRERFVPFLWTFGLFVVQTVVATPFDGAHVSGGWRVFPLFVIFPIYFWIVAFPTFVLGAIRGVASTRSIQWARTERAAILDDALS
jgi:hypothetical protein